jgi:adenine-specific DNA-methyltransferase
MPVAAAERVRASGPATGQRRLRISEASSTSHGAALATLEALISATLQLGADTVDGWSRQEARLAAQAPHVPLPLDDIQDAIASGFDPLGDAYCRIRGSSERRGLGQAYTPPEVISAMVGWAATEVTPSRVIDPGSGSGRFTVAAGRRFPRARLLATDVDPVATLMTRANVAASGLAGRTRVLLRDYRVPNRGGDADGRTLFIGNPPYVRHHQIDPAWKHWLLKTAAARGHHASGLAGLHIHFFLATAEHGSPGDVGVFITSAEWLDVNYGRLLRELLLDGLGGLALHVLDPDAAPFTGVTTTGLITTFRLGSQPKSVRFRRVKTVADLGELKGGRPIARERLVEASRWGPLLRPAPKLPAGWIELGELCRVHRGAVTGANDVWITQAQETDLPEEVLFPSVTKARELFSAGAALAAAHRLRCVIDLPADLDLLDANARKVIDRFLQQAKRRGAAEGYIARNRRAWWRVGLRQPAPILATYMARRPPAFVRNLAEARHINIAHGLYPRQPLPDHVLDRLAAALRTSVVVGQGRTYAGGLTKFEPREMERVAVPSLEILAAQP